MRAPPFLFIASCVLSIALLVGACHHAPAARIAPDAGVVARIRQIRITAPGHACPGQVFAATYDAFLDDGSWIRVGTQRDQGGRVRLPIAALDLRSAEAEPLQDSGWLADPDPLTTLTSGFRLTAALRSNPLVSDTAVVTPEYSCLPHAFRFEGAGGYPGGPGQDGPPVTVRLGFIRTPYYPVLAVASIQLADSTPRYVVADAPAILPAGWLTVQSAGGRGGWGVPGKTGAAGADGIEDCPGGHGGNGGDGGTGGPGGQGGRGGSITIVGPADWPLFAGLVIAQSPGGQRGDGGAGGAGGNGGRGGKGLVGAHGRCPDGVGGANGRKGTPGRAGAMGLPGADPHIVAVDPDSAFGPNPPSALRARVPAVRP